MKWDRPVQAHSWQLPSSELESPPEEHLGPQVLQNQYRFMHIVMLYITQNSQKIKGEKKKLVMRIVILVSHIIQAW
jgi:hypothetical protein